MNKKHKGLKRDTPGKNSEAYVQRICPLHEFCANQKPKKKKKKKKIKQKCIQVVRMNMQMVSVNKAQFAGLNDKQFYFHDGIVSITFWKFFT